MQIGRRIYFDRYTGNVIQDTGELSGDVVESTTEQDFSIYNTLVDRVPETVEMMQLEYGQYRQDFTECNGYRVNPGTGELEFSYPDPNSASGEPSAPVLQKPLTEQLATLELRTEANEAAILALLDFGL